jgi:hypothetical protein
VIPEFRVYGFTSLGNAGLVGPIASLKERCPKPLDNEIFLGDKHNFTTRFH